MVQPEDRVKGRCLERTHMAAATNLIVDFIVDIFKTGKVAIVTGSTPLIVGEGVKVSVGQQQQGQVGASGSRLVGEDLRDHRVARVAVSIRISHGIVVTAPLHHHEHPRLKWLRR